MADYNRSWWDEIRDKGAEVLAAAKQYAEGKASEALSNAKSYTRTFANNGDAETLQAANSYADNGDAQTLSDAKSYASSQSDQARQSAINWGMSYGLGVGRVGQATLSTLDNFDLPSGFYKTDSGTDANPDSRTVTGVIVWGDSIRMYEIQATIDDDLRFRAGSASGFNPWRDIWHNGNLSPMTTDTSQTIDAYKHFTSARLSGARSTNTRLEKYIYLYDYDDGEQQTAMRCYVRNNQWRIYAESGAQAQIDLSGYRVLHRGNFVLPEDRYSGARGSYMTGIPDASVQDNRYEFGDTIAGSLLTPTASASVAGAGLSVSGTWRCMGHVEPNTSLLARVSLWLRIA
jgi:hypothetical protein